MLRASFRKNGTAANGSHLPSTLRAAVVWPLALCHSQCSIRRVFAAAFENTLREYRAGPRLERAKLQAHTCKRKAAAGAAGAAALDRPRRCVTGAGLVITRPAGTRSAGGAALSHPPSGRNRPALNQTRGLQDR